jgi:hypothetical protein
LWILNLNYGFTDEFNFPVFLFPAAAEFRAYFEKFGRVLSAEVMFNRETHKSRGFGFIVFEQERGADSVCAEREHVIDGKVVRNKIFSTFLIAHCLEIFPA